MILNPSGNNRDALDRRFGFYLSDSGRAIFGVEATDFGRHNLNDHVRFNPTIEIPSARSGNTVVTCTRCLPTCLRSLLLCAKSHLHLFFRWRMGGT